MTQKELKELLHYDPDTGVFRWRVDRGNQHAHVGCAAGYDDGQGYIRIEIKGKAYKAHRLAFLYMEGYLPENQVDHKNGNRSDNRWQNLREVSIICQAQNRKISSNNSSGFNGVLWYKSHGKWGVRVTVKGTKYFLGLHDDPISAALARVNFEDCHEDWHCNLQDENRNKLRSMGYRV